jgi:sortase A
VTLGRVLGAVGRSLITTGVLILLFVAYQLWGTGLAEARAQNKLEDEFAALLEQAGIGPSPTAPPTSVDDPDPGPTSSTSSTLPPPPPAPDGGDPVARIVIPEIGVNKIVVEGVNLSDLKRAPGHYPGTSLPGLPGNAAIAGHRTTYGAPFYRLDELEPGDEIFAETTYGEFRYEVTETLIVRPNQVEVLEKGGDARLTLTTCHPRYSARQRMVVVAHLVGEPSDLPPPVVLPEDQPEPDPDEVGPDEAPEPPAFSSDPAGLSGENAGNGPAILWGLAAAFVWFVAWVFARRRRGFRRWLTYAAFTPGFLIVLFLFFENFSRLLPANY